MACRDYEYDYDNWLSRSQERLSALTAMLRELCAAARRQGLEIPRSVLDWLAASTAERPLSREVFDGTVQMLCLMCRTMLDQNLMLPASVQAWWTEHEIRDEHEELAQGLSPTPVYSDFCRVLHQGKHITMEKDGQRLLLPRQDPVNPFAMALLIRRAGLSDDQFRALLQRTAARN